MGNVGTPSVRRLLMSLAVSAASLTGGIVSYSIAAASPAVPEIRGDVATQAREVNCDWPAPDIDLYRQRGDQLLPNTVSFREAAPAVQLFGALPAGTAPCGDGGGGNGPSCLSEFGFDPDNYWVVLQNTDGGASSANLFVAPVDNFTTLTDNDIPTTTGCTVTYEWTFSQVGQPFAGIIDYWNSSGGSTSVTGATSTSMTVSGLDFNQLWSADAIYNLYLCGGNLALRVSDGVNDYDIKGPPCSSFRFETRTYSLGTGFKFDFQDPWGRAASFDQAPDFLGPGGGIWRDFLMVPTVKPTSPFTVTFKVTAAYTLRTGLDWTVNCADSSVNNTVFNAATKNAASTWVDPSPGAPRIYCLEEIQG